MRESGGVGCDGGWERGKRGKGGGAAYLQPILSLVLIRRLWHTNTQSRLCTYLYAYLSVCLYDCLCVCLFASLSFCLSACMYVCHYAMHIGFAHVCA